MEIVVVRSGPSMGQAYFLEDFKSCVLYKCLGSNMGCVK